MKLCKWHFSIDHYNAFLAPEYSMSSAREFGTIFTPKGISATLIILKLPRALGRHTGTVIIRIHKIRFMQAEIKCNNASNTPGKITQTTFAMKRTKDEDFAKMSSSTGILFSSLKAFIAFFETGRFPKGKYAYLISGNKNGRRGKNINAKIKYSVPRINPPVTNHITLPIRVNISTNYTLNYYKPIHKILKYSIIKKKRLKDEKLEREYPEFWSDFSLEVVDKTLLMSDFGFKHQ